MSINTVIGMLLIGLIIFVVEHLIRQRQKKQNISRPPNLNIIEEASTKIVLEIKSTHTLFTVDLTSGIIVRTETQAGRIFNQAELPINQVDKIVLTFEDMPSGIAHLSRAKLMLITMQGQEFEVVREDRYFETSQIAKKIAYLLHKNVENRILPFGSYS